MFIEPYWKPLVSSFGSEIHFAPKAASCCNWYSLGYKHSGLTDLKIRNPFMKTLMTTLRRNTNRVLLATLLLSTILSAPRAYQTASGAPQSSNERIALYQSLLDLTNPWTVMCVAAHPDDEDGTSLIVMRRKYGAHTVSLFSTFGEGGQNAIGPELYEELGAIRARETMAASEIQGSEPHFLGLKDFGFSKSADETFQKWGHEEALRRMVLEIRKLRPDVIITNHSVTSNDHGHHQATARLVVEAFDAAADPKRFPEQLKDGVTTWQVQRLFVRARGQNPAGQGGGEPIVTIDPNEQDPVRGVSFAEQALSALQKHATQGPWPKSVAQMAARFTNSTDGRLPLIRYRLAREAQGTVALKSDAPTFVTGLRRPENVTGELEIPNMNGRPLVDFIDDREKVFNELIKFSAAHHRSMPDTAADTRLSLMRNRIEVAAALAAGASIDVQTNKSVVVPGSTVPVKITVRNSGTQALNFFGCKSDLSTSKPQPEGPRRPAVVALSWRISPGKSFLTGDSLRLPLNLPVNVPRSQHLYDPTGPGVEVLTQCTVGIGSGAAERFAVIETTRLDVAPPIEIADISPSPLVMREPEVGVSSAGVDILPTTPPKVTVKLINHLDRPFKGELAFGRENRSPETRRKIEIPSQETVTLTATVPISEHNRTSPSDNMWFALRNTGSHENLIKRSVPFVRVNARVSRGVNVGYIRGFDFSLPHALDALGVESKELSVDEVKTTDLSTFSTVIVDNRVYESEPELIAVNQKLLDFAKNGGTLIVFYHKSDEWNPDPKRNRPQLAPYKLIVGNDRVTDENAPITVLEPEHSLLNFPNKLGSEDFTGWIQERGVYYPKEWDPQFHALLQSNDPGEAPLKGGLLVADYGKGHYIYSSMVWYRQLRAGLPGAYRMLANMISYRK
jgi:LmbE family N-acetylglucosaminyl deacetylase